ncbi:MAG: hypothetical protein KC613_13370 [Myxococcales bacterium]|nr:hypothetical protein [Myxococcales bacterium]
MTAFALIALLLAPPGPAFHGDTAWSLTGTTYVTLTGGGACAGQPAEQLRACRIERKLGALGQRLAKHWRLKARRALAAPGDHREAFGLRVLSIEAYPGSGEVVQVRFDGRFLGPARLKGVDHTAGRGTLAVSVPRQPETLDDKALLRWAPTRKAADAEQVQVLVTPASPQDARMARGQHPTR